MYMYMYVQVVYAEQQIAKRREKRDYSTPSDAMWPKQWYLVSHVYMFILYSFLKLGSENTSLIGILLSNRNTFLNKHASFNIHVHTCTYMYIPAE